MAGHQFSDGHLKHEIPIRSSSGDVRTGSNRLKKEIWDHQLISGL